MSMNFGREMSLLRVRFTEAGSPERAEQKRNATGSEAKFLGAEDAEVAAAADALVESYPQMGRAQMTAFVRTLWQSDIHELQVVGARILAARAALLEPADQPFVEGLIKKCDVDTIEQMLADDVLGTLTAKNKKLWRDLKRMAKAVDNRLRRAAVRACRTPVLADEGVFSRFAELVEPMFEDADADLLEAIDSTLGAIAAEHADAAKELAARHGRELKLPKKK